MQELGSVMMGLVGWWAGWSKGWSATKWWVGW